ncbi:NAD(P)-binding protein [Hyaloscypha variabilis F]|uniref:NAD(P)-binding protein n=1 Tax=Hyaloscypha variabilis (strain UAMH 11265 / GT02V1 / F) TaxID=1149755 RepID=A0A2J6R3C8_HYAVF|nr:NAD(P)-binding protein [Hyaloscypha variabilis F]
MAPHATSPPPNEPITRLPPPPRPPFSPSPPRLLIIGAGNRGHAYASAISTSTNGVLVSVIEPIPTKLSLFGRKFIWGKREPVDGESFRDWKDFVSWELERREREKRGEDVVKGVDAVFVCVQDRMHKDVVLGLAPLKLHVLCEKPLATSLDDCVEIYKAVCGTEGDKRLFGIGHVLRYSPHNVLLRKLVREDRVIGDVMAVNHTEPVGWWHFTHSYVRGNWRKESTSAPSLLAKSCHDIDILLWLLCSPIPGPTKPPHLPTTISSSGSLQYFTKHRKPTLAGPATNCLSCPAEPGCQFSAKRIYMGPQMQGRQAHFVSIVLPKIEDIVSSSGHAAGDEALLAKLSEDYDSSLPESEIEKRNWFGRCVFESDNNVCDNQTVTLSWENDPIALDIETPLQALEGRGAKTATLHMVAFSQKICQRFTHIYGEYGEIFADGDKIEITDFKTGEKTVHWPYVPEGGGHGDGDEGLARQFVLAVDRVKNWGEGVESAQEVYVGCSVEEMVRSHAVVFAAEEARRGRRVVDFGGWWEREVGGRLKGGV